MAESDRDHSSEMEARLDEKHHRWLRLEEIFDVLRDPNSLISEKPAITPPSGSIFLFDKKLLKRFRKDGYEWKKTKDGKRTKEGHEKLKHLQATDATNSNSARTSEPENTVSDEDNGICDNMVDSSTIRVFSPYPSNFGYYETDPTASEEGKSKVTPNATIEEVVVMSSHERLHELDRASASNTMILVGSNCFSTDIGPMILAIFEQLEQSVLAYSEAYPEYDMAKNLTEQVKATKQLLQPKVQFCDSKEREFQELAKRKFWIETRQAAIVAEIHGAIKETEPIQAQLEKLLLQQDQFKENEDNLKTILDIGDGLWTTLKNIIHPHLPT